MFGKDWVEKMDEALHLDRSSYKSTDIYKDEKYVIRHVGNEMHVDSLEPAPGAGLPIDAKARKEVPIYSGCLMYFPDAIAAVAALSFIGNEQHNPGAPLHWDRNKSQDEHDALMRHLMEAGTNDTDGIRHSAKVAWRALAALQKEIEGEQ